MLILSRRENERIVIDGRITITILRAKGGGVRVGIEAPPEVPIVRDELRKIMADEQILAQDAHAT